MEKRENKKSTLYNCLMGRGDDKTNNPVVPRNNPFRQEIQKKTSSFISLKEQRKKEVTLLGSAFFDENQEWGESLKTIHQFSEGLIPPKEIVKAQSAGLTSELKGDTLRWLKRGAPLEESSLPSLYRKQKGRIYKEWQKDGQRSRHPDLGPALVPLLPSDTLDSKARWEWWYKGRLLGTYSDKEGYEGSNGEKLGKLERPQETTPWPGNDPLFHALSRCNDKNEEKIIDTIFYETSNPFVIYQGRHVEEIKLIKELARKNSLGKEKAEKAIANLIERGVLQRKWHGIFSGKRATLTVSDSALGKLKKSGEEGILDIDKSLEKRVERLESLWRDPSEESLKAILREE